MDYSIEEIWQVTGLKIIDILKKYLKTEIFRNLAIVGGGFRMADWLTHQTRNINIASRMGSNPDRGKLL